MDGFGLDVQRNLPVPLFKQVKEGLKQKIVNGVWPPGRQIPSERELSDAFGISRLTVRLAMNELVAEELIERRQGKGTYVKAPSLEQPLSRFYSFTEEMIRRGLRPRTIVRNLAADIQGPDEFECRVHCVTRVRLADEEPIMYETTFLPAPLCPGLDRAKLESLPLYDLLKRVYGLRFGHAKEAFEPVILDDKAAKELGVKKGSPGLSLERRLFDEAGRLIEHTNSLVRGDRCRYVMEWTVTWK